MARSCRVGWQRLGWFVALVTLMPSCNADRKAEPVHWDLSESRSLGIIGLKTEPGDEELHQLLAELEGLRDVKLSLADGRTFTGTVDSVYARPKDGDVGSLLFEYPPQTLAAATAVAKSIASNFEYSSAAIEQWHDETASVGENLNFVENLRGKTFTCQIRIQRSYDPQRPWIVFFKLYPEPQQAN